MNESGPTTPTNSNGRDKSPLSFTTPKRKYEYFPTENITAKETADIIAFWVCVLAGAPFVADQMYERWPKNTQRHFRTSEPEGQSSIILPGPGSMPPMGPMPGMPGMPRG